MSRQNFKSSNIIKYTLLFENGDKEEQSIIADGMTILKLKTAIANTHDLNPLQIRIEHPMGIKDSESLLNYAIDGLQVKVLSPTKKIQYQYKTRYANNENTIYITEPATVGDLISTVANRNKTSFQSVKLSGRSTISITDKVDKNSYSLEFLKNTQTPPLSQKQYILPNRTMVETFKHTFYDAAYKLSDCMLCPASHIVFYDEKDHAILKETLIKDCQSQRIRVDSKSLLRYKMQDNDKIETIEVTYNEKVIDLKNKISKENPGKYQFIDDRDFVYPDAYPAANLPAGSKNHNYITVRIVDNQPIYLLCNDLSGNEIVKKFDQDKTLTEAINDIMNDDSYVFFDDRNQMFDMNKMISSVTSERLCIKRIDKSSTYKHSSKSITNRTNSVQIKFNGQQYNMAFEQSDNIDKLKEKFCAQYAQQTKATYLIFDGYSLSIRYVRDIPPNTIINAHLKTNSTKTIDFYLNDDCYKHQITIDTSTIKTPEQLLSKVSAIFGIKADCLKYESTPKSIDSIKDVRFIIQKPSKDIKFKFQDNSEFVIKDAHDKEFNQILLLFTAQQKVFFSETAIQQIKFNVWDTDVPKTGQHLKAIPASVTVKVITDNLVKLTYNGKTYFVSNQDTVNQSIELICKSELPVELTPIIKQNGVIPPYNPHMDPNSLYTVEATYCFIFHQNGEKDKKIFNYLATVDQIRQTIATVYSQPNFVLTKDEVIISDGNNKVPDTALLKDLKTINLDIHPNSIMIQFEFREGTRDDTPSLITTDVQVKFGTTKDQLVDQIKKQFNINKEIKLKYISEGREKYIGEKFVIDESTANQTIIVDIRLNVIQSIKKIQRTVSAQPKIRQPFEGTVPEPVSKEEHDKVRIPHEPPLPSGTLRHNSKMISQRRSKQVPRSGSRSFHSDQGLSLEYKTNLDDKIKLVLLPAGATIYNLREMIATCEGASVSNVSILHAGMRFEDDNIVERLGLEGSVIFAYILSPKDIYLMQTRSIVFTSTDDMIDIEEEEEEPSD